MERTAISGIIIITATFSNNIKEAIFKDLCLLWHELICLKITIRYQYFLRICWIFGEVMMNFFIVLLYNLEFSWTGLTLVWLTSHWISRFFLKLKCFSKKSSVSDLDPDSPKSLDPDWVNRDTKHFFGKCRRGSTRRRFDNYKVHR